MTTRLTNKERKDQMVTLIERGLKEPGTIAKCFSLFHRYSLFNTIHVGFQQMKRFGEITPIKGFKAWNDLNRVVRKGETGLEVCFPVFIKKDKLDKDGKLVIKNGKPVQEQVLIGFDMKNVHFAYSQTDVLDPSKETKDESNNDLNFDWKLACKELGIELIPYNSIDGNCQGFRPCGKMQIAINPVAKNKMEVAVHEMAHAIMHSTEKSAALPRPLKEVQAELVTYIICTMVGTDEETLSNCRGYIQGWLGSNELTPDLASDVISCANKILSKGCGKKSYESKE